MTNINIGAIIESCDLLARRIITVQDEYHGSPWLLLNCMKAFESTPPAEAITFSVFLNYPVMKRGEATVHRDGALEIRVDNAE